MLIRNQAKVIDHGMFAEHNMNCAVCWVESAVLDMQLGVFLPCWECQGKGWSLTKKRRRFSKK